MLRAWLKIQLNVHYHIQIARDFESIQWNNIIPSWEVWILLITTAGQSFYLLRFLPLCRITATSTKGLPCSCREASLPAWSCSISVYSQLYPWHLLSPPPTLHTTSMDIKRQVWLTVLKRAWRSLHLKDSWLSVEAATWNLQGHWGEHFHPCRKRLGTC